MLYKRLFQLLLDESYFLFGPRGTGKTTFLKQFYPDAMWVNLLKPSEERLFSMHPELLIERLDAVENPSCVIIDEIQKVPKILDVVHELIEERKGIVFILTGSSSRKIKREGVNLLAGRALWRNFHPFLAKELGEDFVLEKALLTGMIPLIWTSPSPQKKLESYIDLYIQEEVKAEALVRQIGSFSRFLQAMAYSHAAVLNLNNVSRECEVPRRTLDAYLQILEEMFLGYRIPVFEQRAKRVTISHSKFYYFDPGVYRVLKKQGFLDPTSEMEGPALEGLIAEHLRAWVDNQKDKHELFFWRTRAGLEVDFIIYGPSAFYAIEVKNGKSISPKDIKGLKEFSRDYPEAISILLYRGSVSLKKEGILCLPIESFIKKIDPLSSKLF